MVKRKSSDEIVYRVWPHFNILRKDIHTYRYVCIDICIYISIYPFSKMNTNNWKVLVFFSFLRESTCLSPTEELLVCRFHFSLNIVSPRSVILNLPLSFWQNFLPNKILLLASIYKKTNQIELLWLKPGVRPRAHHALTPAPAPLPHFQSGLVYQMMPSTAPGKSW